ncbi:FtsH protease activity modulator HflK [Algicola sagamiensis]|uniref:FtsH protease activity modulator HflK n=1 Tax=Algicola sagamiensis TaxID=163869 RepID=UPI000372F226|nr:FtsH protease activity modulator HflK [Algicola sagamiensis]
MAWNEPGNQNGKNNDPWKQRNDKDQGPPDLDEIFKGLGDKFGGVFGGGNKRNTSFSGVGLTLLLIIGLISWGISGFYTIKEREKGVVLRFGEFNTLVDAGLHWKPTFIDTVISIDTESVLDKMAKGDMLTQDENVVHVAMEVQYKVLDAKAYKFNVTDADNSLREAIDSALRYVIGHSTMDQILTTGREDIRQKTWKELESIIEPYQLGLQILDVNFKDARPPEPVKDAFDDAIAAQEDEERFIREAEAYQREKEPKARGRVKRILEEAEAYKGRVILEAQGEVARFSKLLPEYTAAPEVTRQRLYLETMESVMSNSSKVLVDTKNGGNMMYLPLDKIIQRGNATSNSQMLRHDSHTMQPQYAPTSGVNTKPTTSYGRGSSYRDGR